MRPQLRSDCRHFCAGIVVAVLVFTGAGYAQLTSASLVGSVRDEGGAIIVGATVTLRNLATNQTRSDVTIADGLYRISDLPAAT